MLNDDQCWNAVVAKDKSQDGRFFFGVTTTGVYCRPSCAARRPLRRNVRFYPTPAAAEDDGLRPCRRCRPREDGGHPHAAVVRELCDHIRQHCDSGEPLTLEELSARAGLSPSHLRRTFRDVVGVTPRQFVEACRMETVKRELRQGGSVTRAIYDAGFGSSSRLYERVDSRLGMTPLEYRAGGLGLTISYATLDSPAGLILLGATDRGLCFVQFGGSSQELLAELRAEFPRAELRAMSEPPSPQFQLWADALRRHLAGEQPHLDLPVAVRASAFQFRVWSYLQTIPYGEVRSYAEVATAVGRPQAVRAVARACAANRTALLIPCHRVIRADGDLGGYRWGRDRKRLLLERERAAASG